MTQTTRRNFLGKLLGTAAVAAFAPKLLAKETPGEVMGILRRGTVTYPFVCSGAFIPPQLERNAFEVTTYRAAGEPW
jgi:hypothetical protein